MKLDINGYLQVPILCTAEKWSPYKFPLLAVFFLFKQEKKEGMHPCHHHQQSQNPIYLEFPFECYFSIWLYHTPYKSVTPLSKRCTHVKGEKCKVHPEHLPVHYTCHSSLASVLEPQINLFNHFLFAYSVKLSFFHLDFEGRTPFLHSLLYFIAP